VTASKQRTLWYAVVVLALMLVLAIELIVPASRQSMAFDEGCHAFAGYSYWTRADFGLNPEHPPLVKMLAALPLLSQASALSNSGPFSVQTTVLYWVEAVFLFQPQCRHHAAPRPHGSSDAHDCSSTCRVCCWLRDVWSDRRIARTASLRIRAKPGRTWGFDNHRYGRESVPFGTVYAFYRYVKKPSVLRLAVTGILAGLTLAAKHSGILWISILCLLALAEILRCGQNAPLCQGGRLKCSLRFAGSLFVVGLISFAILWAFYRFRYQATPHGEIMIPSLAEYAGYIQHPWEQKVILFAARHHLLPESYLVGLVDVIVFPGKYLTMYLFGRIYRHAHWFYFPAAFVIKSTLGVCPSIQP